MGRKRSSVSSVGSLGSSPQQDQQQQQQQQQQQHRQQSPHDRQQPQHEVKATMKATMTATATTEKVPRTESDAETNAQRNRPRRRRGGGGNGSGNGNSNSNSNKMKLMFHSLSVYLKRCFQNLRSVLMTFHPTTVVWIRRILLSVAAVCLLWGGGLDGTGQAQAHAQALSLWGSPSSSSSSSHDYNHNHYGHQNNDDDNNNNNSNSYSNSNTVYTLSAAFLSCFVVLVLQDSTKASTTKELDRWLLLSFFTTMISLGSCIILYLSSSSSPSSNHHLYNHHYYYYSPSSPFPLSEKEVASFSPVPPISPSSQTPQFSFPALHTIAPSLESIQMLLMGYALQKLWGLFLAYMLYKDVQQAFAHWYKKQRRRFRQTTRLLFGSKHAKADADVADVTTDPDGSNKHGRVNGAATIGKNTYYRNYFDSDDDDDDDDDREGADDEESLRFMEIHIKILQGRGLVAKDKNWWGRRVSSDPYVKVYQGPNLIGKTSIIKRTLNPVWDVVENDDDTTTTTIDETTTNSNSNSNSNKKKQSRISTSKAAAVTASSTSTFRIATIQRALDVYRAMELNIFDHDKLSSDDSMGTVYVPIPTERNVKVKSWYPVERGEGIKYCRNAKGHLQVEIEVKSQLNKSFKRQLLLQAKSSSLLSKNAPDGDDHDGDNHQTYNSYFI